MLDFNTRDYNFDHFKTCKDMFITVQNRDETDYRNCIRGQDVPTSHSNLKLDALVVGGNAYLNITHIREKIDSTYEIIKQFETEVTKTTSYVINTTDSIKSILDEVNSALVRMNDSLNGVGDYQGKTVTAKDLKEAGIDEKKCTALKDKMWNDFISNNDVVASYINKCKNSPELSPEDYKKLEDIYDYYVDHRFSGGTDATAVPNAVLKNCVDVYELLNPDAKRVFDEKFGDIFGKDANVDKNILRIKYTTYTSDPELRDIIIKYMDDDRLTIVVDPTKTKGGYTAADHTITLNLYADDSDPNCKRCFGFFHEFGHFLDSVTGKDDKDSSLVLSDTLKSDLRDDLISVANEYNSNLPINSRLSDYGISQVVDYIMDTTNNPNVVFLSGQDPNLPEEWTAEQKDLYLKIREKYGYQEYVYNEHDRVAHNPDSTNDVYTRNKNNGTYGIVDDTVAGLTDGKIGATVSGHAYSIERGAVRPGTTEALQEEVSKGYYYFDPSSTDPDNHPMYNPEFFAEVFEYKVIDKDLSATRDIFGKSVEQVEGIIKDISERD